MRWGLRVPPQLVTVVKPGMGILLASTPPAYLDFFTALAASKTQRAHPRVAARLEVRYYHRKQFLKEYTETISQGGLFIATTEPLERDAEVRIELMIPDLAASLPITGRVAYRLDEKEAAALGTTPGVGVQITALDPRTDETLRVYVQRLMRYYEGAAGAARGRRPAWGTGFPGGAGRGSLQRSRSCSSRPGGRS